VKSLRLMLSGISTLALIAALSGCGKDAAPTAAVPGLDTTPPVTPAALGVTADPSSGSLQVHWTASPDADVATYRVYLYSPDPSRDNAYVQVGETSASATSWSIPAASDVVTQYYRVRAVDGAGNVSAYSAGLAVDNGPDGVVGAGTPTPGRRKD